MRSEAKVNGRIRLIGLWASIVAVVALSFAVLSHNRDVGFGRTVTHDEQMSLLLVAALLFVLQVVLYVVHRARSGSGNAMPHSESARARAEKES